MGRLGTLASSTYLVLALSPHGVHAQFDQEAAADYQEQQDAEQKHWDEVCRNGMCEPPDSPSYDDDSGGWMLGALVLGAGALIAIPIIAAMASSSDDEPATVDPTQPNPKTPPAPDKPTLNLTYQERAAIAEAKREAAIKQAATIGLSVLASSVALGFLALITMWRLFAKAGRSGWSAVVPIYNCWVLLELAGLPGWLLFVPVANWVLLAIVAPFGLARRFGKSSWFGVGLMLVAPVFYPVLAFSSARYQERAAAG